MLFFEIDETIGKVSYLVSSLENCFFLEGEWGASLAFSNMPFDDFLFIMFAILLEAHLIFVSKNVTLLTATQY